MKLFEEPKLELIAFAVEDVVSTSTQEELPPVIGSPLDPMACVG